MRIVYCINSTYRGAGTERITTEKSNWLAEHGYEVFLVTTNQKGREDFYKLSADVKRIDLPVNYYKLGNSKGFFDKLILPIKRRYYVYVKHKRYLKDILDELKPDITISTSIGTSNEKMILPFINDKSKKIAEFHFARWSELFYPRKHFFYKSRYKLLNKIKFLFFRKYDACVALTNEDAENYKFKKNLNVIPNFMKSNSTQKSLLNNKSMIAVGRLDYQKGFDMLIDAWRLVHDKHPDWHLNIFGEGKKEVELKNQIKDLKLNNIVSIHKPVKDIYSEYLKVSALVLSSRFEGLPLILLESMSCGVPPISFDCPCGPKDIIKDGHNGLLVKSGDLKELADAICRVIESPELRKKLGDNAYMDSKQYDKDIIMQQWVDLFNKLCGLDK